MKVGIVIDVDDGEPIRRGWGFNLFMTDVIWTHESAYNTIVSLFETKEQAKLALAEFFKRESEKTSLQIKALQAAKKKLDESRTNILDDRPASVSPLIAVSSAMDEARAALDKKQNIKKLKQQLKSYEK